MNTKTYQIQCSSANRKLLLTPEGRSYYSLIMSMIHQCGGWLRMHDVEVLTIMCVKRTVDTNKLSNIILTMCDKTIKRFGKPQTILLSNNLGDTIAVTGHLDMRSIKNGYIAACGSPKLTKEVMEILYPEVRWIIIEPSHGCNIRYQNSLDKRKILDNMFDVTLLTFYKEINKAYKYNEIDRRAKRIFTSSVVPASFTDTYNILDFCRRCCVSNILNYFVVVCATADSTVECVVCGSIHKTTGKQSNGCLVGTRTFAEYDWKELEIFLDKNSLDALIINIENVKIPIFHRFHIVNTLSPRETIGALVNAKGYIGIDSWLSCLSARLCNMKADFYALIRTANVNCVYHCNFFFGKDINILSRVPSVIPFTPIGVHTLLGLSAASIHYY